MALGRSSVSIELMRHFVKTDCRQMLFLVFAGVLGALITAASFLLCTTSVCDEEDAGVRTSKAANHESSLIPLQVPSYN